MILFCFLLIEFLFQMSITKKFYLLSHSFSQKYPPVKFLSEKDRKRILVCQKHTTTDAQSHYNNQYTEVKFCTDIHVPRLNPTDFSDPLMFHPASLWSLYFVFMSEMSQQLLDGLAWNVIQTFIVLRGWNFSVPIILLVPPIGQNFHISNEVSQQLLDELAWNLV